MTWRRSSKKKVTHLQRMKKVLFSFTLFFLSHLLTPFFFLSLSLSLFIFWRKPSIKTCVFASLFFLDRSPVGVKLSVAHTGHLCLIFKGLGPSMAGQDFARYGQKKTFRSVPKLQLELSTDQLITRGLCRQPSETSDHVRLSLRLSFAVLLSLSLFLCSVHPSFILCVYEAWHVEGLLGQVCWTAAAALYDNEIPCKFTGFSEISSHKVEESLQFENC